MHRQWRTRSSQRDTLLGVFLSGGIRFVIGCSTRRAIQRGYNPTNAELVSQVAFFGQALRICTVFIFKMNSA